MTKRFAKRENLPRILVKAGGRVRCAERSVQKPETLASGSSKNNIVPAQRVRPFRFALQEYKIGAREANRRVGIPFCVSN